MYYYQLLQDISIDASSVGSKSRNTIGQYLPNRHDAHFRTKNWMLAYSETCVLKLCVYEGARYDTSRRFGQGYVIVWLIERTDIQNCGYHLCNNNLLTTYNSADFLLYKGAFITGTIPCTQLPHPPKEITGAKPKVGKKTYYIWCCSL